MASNEFPEKIYIVGIGGTLRPGSSTEQAVRAVLAHAAAAGAETTMFAGPDLNFPMYNQVNTDLPAPVLAFIAALRRADAIVLASPAYHAGISGLIKNALDYTEAMARDPATYWEGRAVGCVASGADWQGASNTVSALRSVVHALHGWPSPLGIALNSRKPLFDPHGAALQPETGDQFRIMARQLVDFAVARRAATVTRSGTKVVLTPRIRCQTDAAAAGEKIP
jgi:FMN reductase